MTSLDLALSYARSAPIFPCRAAAFQDRGEKSPYPSKGLNAATKIEHIIRRWWSDYPDALIGLPTGHKSGCFVLDLDIKPDADGHDWLTEQEAAHGPLPATRRVRTANGGTHIFFKMVDGVRNRGTLAKAVDIRGEGGYVIAAGSVMADGRKYVLTEDCEPADAPRWLLDLVLPKPAKELASAAAPFEYQSGTNQAYVDGAVDGELRDLVHTPAGGRGYALNASAFNLGTLVGAGALERREAETGLYQAAVSNGLLAKDGEREVRAKIRRGLDAGMRSPRQIPEPDTFHFDDNTRLIDVSRIIENGLKKHQKAADASVTADTGVPVNDEVAANDNEVFRATPFEWREPKTIEPREFIYGKHLIRKYVSVTVAPGGVGKTNLICAEALAMASGIPLLGIRPKQRLKVWIFNAEDPREELERRLMGACIHFNLKPKDIEGQIFLDTGREQELCVAVEDKKAGVRYVEPLIEAVVAEIKRREIDVMVIDPFVSTHGVSENDNGAIDKVAKLWTHIADECDCAIEIVHHLRKVSGREATVEDSRGAVSLLAASRSSRVLNFMSPEQAKEAGIPSSEQFQYISVDYGKASMSPRTKQLEWRKFESVPLGNGRGLMRPQDHAPVLTEWKWPTAEDVAESVPPEQLERIKSRIGAGAYRYDYRTDDWIGKIVAEVLDIDVPTGLKKTNEHKEICRIVDALIETDVLTKSREPGFDEKNPAAKKQVVRVAGREPRSEPLEPKMNLSPAQFEAVSSAMGRAHFNRDYRSPNWIGGLISEAADVHLVWDGLKKTAMHREIDGVVDKWIAEGRLEEFTVTGANSSQPNSTSRMVCLPGLASSWGSQRCPSLDLSEQQTAEVQSNIADGTYPYDYQAVDWVGHQFAEVLGIDLPKGKCRKTNGHRTIERVVNQWIEEGKLECLEVAGLNTAHPKRVSKAVRVA